MGKEEVESKHQTESNVCEHSCFLSIESCDLSGSRVLQRRAVTPAVFDEVKEELDANQTLKVNTTELGAHMEKWSVQTVFKRRDMGHST